VSEANEKGRGFERRSDAESADEAASRGRENLRATTSKLFVTKSST